MRTALSLFLAIAYPALGLEQSLHVSYVSDCGKTLSAEEFEHCGDICKSQIQEFNNQAHDFKVRFDYKGAWDTIVCTIEEESESKSSRCRDVHESTDSSCSSSSSESESEDDEEQHHYGG